MTADAGSDSAKHLRLALLTNFIPPYRVPVFRELARRFGVLRVLISTAMEADRFWTPETGGLDVRVQRNFTVSSPWNHPSGFHEKIFIHFPYDTLFQLISFRPDVMISAEFGFRTVGALLYRILFRRCRLVVWATISEETEAQRSRTRKLLRHVIVRFADAIMTNGRSGIRYLEQFRAPSEKLFAVPQTTDVGAFASVSPVRAGAAAYRLIYAGRLVIRKQVVQFIGILAEWCRLHPNRQVEFWIAGDGPERGAIETVSVPANLQVKLLGNISYPELPGVYEQAGALVLPTLADEWGLVINEALAAGLPVLGSLYSQAVQDMVEDGTNGWTYYIDHRDQVLLKLGEFLNAPEDRLNEMRRAARETALRLTPEVVVDRMLNAVRFARGEGPIAKVSRSWKILVVHNFYQQPGGEDQVFESESRMLELAGHTVTRFTETNDRVDQMGKAALAAATIWNRDAYRRIYALVSSERFDVAHFHNTFPILSPSCYYAARRAGAAVVQTLHNYRLICPAATLLRDGRPCEDCVGKPLPWHGVQHSCYRGSRTASAGVAAMLALHHAAGTWRRAVDAYIALTAFSRSRFLAGGLPAERVFIKPNFAEPDPGMGPGGDYLLFAGRLSPEKGLDVLLRAWSLRRDLPPLRIAGGGPLEPWLQTQIAGLPNVQWIGRLPRGEVLEQMRHARALILPSIWYENFPVSVVEAYATGLPVIASDAGTLPELVHSGRTGLVFRSGDARELAAKVLELDRDPVLQSSLRRNCRAEFLNLYQRERNGTLLLEIYRKAIEMRAKGRV